VRDWRAWMPESWEESKTPIVKKADRRMR